MVLLILPNFCHANKGYGQKIGLAWLFSFIGKKASEYEAVFQGEGVAPVVTIEDA